MSQFADDDDVYDYRDMICFCDVYYYMRWRLKLEGETENMGVWMNMMFIIILAFVFAG